MIRTDHPKRKSLAFLQTHERSNGKLSISPFDINEHMEESDWIYASGNDLGAIHRTKMIMKRDWEIIYGEPMKNEPTLVPAKDDRHLDRSVHSSLQTLFSLFSGDRLLVLTFTAYSPYDGCHYEQQALLGKISLDAAFTPILAEALKRMTLPSCHVGGLTHLLLDHLKICSTCAAPGKVDTFFKKLLKAEKDDTVSLRVFLEKAKKDYSMRHCMDLADEDGCSRHGKQKFLFGAFDDMHLWMDCFEYLREDYATVFSVYQDEENNDTYYWKSFPSEDWCWDEYPAAYYIQEGGGGVHVHLEKPMSISDVDNTTCPGCNGIDMTWYEEGKCNEKGGLCSDCGMWEKALEDDALEDALSELEEMKEEGSLSQAEQDAYDAIVFYQTYKEEERFKDEEQLCIQCACAKDGQRPPS